MEGSSSETFSSINGKAVARRGKNVVASGHQLGIVVSCIDEQA